MESFKRTFEMGDDINPDEISASYDKGILHIRIGRKQALPEGETPVKITID